MSALGGRGATVPRAVLGVVFDLDGTLIDSRRDLATAVNRLRRDLGLGPLAVARVEAIVGEGARVLVKRALAAERPAVSIERALEILLAHYDDCCVDSTLAYPGIAELVEALAVRCPVAVLTNKPERLTRKILAHLGLLGWFRLVVGGDTLAIRKPEPGGLIHIAMSLEVAPSEVVLVGDSRIDAETANAAGARFVRVEWGYGKGEGRPAVEMTPRASSVEELRSILLP